MATERPFILPDAFREISVGQREEFRENGHLHVRGLMSSPEIGVYRPLIGGLVKKQRIEKHRGAIRSAGGQPFLEVMNSWVSDPALRPFILSKRLGKVAADLLGVGNVRIYHDQVVFKEPGGGATPWQQDQYRRPLDTENTITLWMPLVDITVGMGMLTFAAGSHKDGTFADPRIAEDGETVYRNYIKERQFPISFMAGMRAGDASWHYGNTLHCAPANGSERMREAVRVIYMAEGARVARPLNAAQADDWNNWLMGLPPGRLAASDLNPLVLD